MLFHSSGSSCDYVKIKDQFHELYNKVEELLVREVKTFTIVEKKSLYGI